MGKSGFLLKLTKIAVNGLVKFTNADIRTHGEENIVNQPIVYVINHFTRMETFFLPFVINRITGSEVLSLAAGELFGGGFGSFLKKMGAISTNAPDRDRTMISALLEGNMACMIFPEGQMIKDKKMIERGKYMVYNSGIRRPPHTGAAIIALQAEFYRQKLRHFKDIGFNEGINAYLDHFEIDRDADIDKIINLETNILPVNITYFPLRARSNIINTIASKFVGNLPRRVEEELEVEGSMLIDGVDIDINFGKPIPVGQYIEKSRNKKKIGSRNFYLRKEEQKKDLKFTKESTRLMYRYMHSIYNMTTVNHDHIFSYILSKYKSRRIDEIDFRNRAYLAINMIKDDLKYNHTFLSKKQDSLLLDDKFDRYDDFIEALKTESLVTVKDGYLVKKNDRFSKSFEFHQIRRDNIVEVIKNEIEPLNDLVKSLNRLMKTPAFRVRKKIRDKYLQIDDELFESDYKEFFIEGESKPRAIGRPFVMKRFFCNKGILLIHGYMSAPEEVRELAEFLYNSGYNVYAVRLRGHGTAPEDLASRTWEDWLRSVRRGHVILSNFCKDIAIAGFSTGAGLALQQAMNKHFAYKCVISICAPLKIASIGSSFASTVVRWNQLLDKVNIQKGKKEFIANNPQNPHINYFRNPISGVWELEKLMKIVEDSLKDIHVPTLIVQGNRDPVVNPESGAEIFEKLGSEDKGLCIIDIDKHVIIRDDASTKVFPSVLKFINDHF